MVTSKNTFILSATTSGTGTVSAIGLTCSGSACIGTYGYNTVVNLTASDSNVTWAGCDSSNGSQCSVTMITDKSITATFVPSEYTLTITKEGTGSGEVTGAGTYNNGATAVVTAVADSGSSFTGWSGDCAGTVSPLDVVVNSTKTCIATFDDTQAPKLVVSTLSDGSWTNNVTLNISGTAADNIGTVSLTINGIPVTVGPDGAFSEVYTHVVGPNVINTIAADLAGLQATDTRTINFDPTAPYIVITTPSDNSKTKQVSIPVSGTVDESSAVTVKVNSDSSSPAKMNGNDFAADVTLTNGINTIEITATDLATNQSTVKRTVTLDNQNPTLAITEPNQDIRTNQASILLRGEVTDISATTVTITIGKDTYMPSVVGGQFEQPLTFTMEGAYQIQVTATDEVGNASAAQRNIIYDLTPPSISLNPVATPTNNTTQVLTGSVDAESVVTVLCSTAIVGQVSYPTQTTWMVTLTNMTVRSNVIQFFATDAAGNISGAITATIEVDVQAPNTEITSTSANPTTSTSASFSFTSTETGSTFQCQLDNGGYQPCVSPKTYAELTLGDHLFSVFATDTAGNTDPTPSTYTWIVVGEQLPDLSGLWKSISLKSKGSKVMGALQVTNTGTTDSGPFTVVYYLSNDGITFTSIIASDEVKKLDAGKSVNLNISYSSTTSVSNKYIIAVVDPGNQVAETNENNNLVVIMIP